MRVILLWAMLAAYGFAALMGVVAALSWDAIAINLLVTALVVAGASTVGFLLAVFLERGNRSIRWLMHLGLVCTAIALFGWLVLIWASSREFATGYDEFIARGSAFFTFAGFWCLYVGYSFFLRVRHVWYRLLVWFLFGCSVYFLLLLEIGMIDEDVVEFIADDVFGDEEIFARTLIALIVLFAAGSLALPVIWFIDRTVQSTDDAVLGRKFEVALTCPRCGLNQELPTKLGHCKQCRLEIRIKIEEPRCACGFLLYRFEGESCPECGRPVPESQRWATSGI